MFGFCSCMSDNINLPCLPLFRLDWPGKSSSQFVHPEGKWDLESCNVSPQTFNDLINEHVHMLDNS